MLFLLYVNDLPTTVKASKVACFADDTKVLKQIDNLQETVGLQNDIYNRLNSWAIDNGLTFNETKCKCQRITRKKTPVEYPYSLNESVLKYLHEKKDLAAWVSSELCLKKQLIKNKIFVPHHYTTSPYATQIWALQTIELIKRVERVQRRATK